MNMHLRFQLGDLNKATKLPMAIIACLTLTIISSARGGAFVNTGSLNVARCNHTATLLLNGKVLVVGGFDVDLGHMVEGAPYQVLSSAELYDPATGTWALTGSMSTGRVFHTMTLLPNGKVLVAGGFAGGSAAASAELYDPTTGTWTLTDVMNTPRREHTATLLLSGKVLVSGGGAGGFLSSAELFDPATQTWTETGELNNTRFRHTATLLTNGQVLVTGGIVSSGHNPDTELYDPNTEMWLATGPLNPGRSWHATILLSDGRVMVTGGENINGGFSNADLYNPDTGIWTPTSPMNAVRGYHTATLLPNRKVLIAGGDWEPNSFLSSGILYDSTAESWSPLAIMNHNRSVHTATLLPNGKVLVAGGEYWVTSPDGMSTIDSGVHSSAELYVPTPIVVTGKMLASGACQLTFTNDPGSAFDVLASTNLFAPPSNWTTLGNTTETSPGQFQFTDLQATNFIQRFYRVRSQ